MNREDRKMFGREEIENALEDFWKRAKKYVNGIVVIKDGYVGIAGRVELVKANFDERLITKWSLF